MARVEPGKGIALITETPHGIEVIIPSKINIFMFLFHSVWLIFWVFGEISVTNILFTNTAKGWPELFLFVWLCGWTVGGVWASYTLLWQLKGKEIIRVNSSQLSHKRDLLGYGTLKEYDIAHIKEMRTNEIQSNFFSGRNVMGAWGLSGGTIVFDYGHKTVRLGAGIDEAEAKHIIRELVSRYRIHTKENP